MGINNTVILGIYGAGGLGREVFELARVLNINEKRWSDIIFIDDHPEYVKSMINKGVTSYVAGWGYNQYSSNNKIIELNLNFLISSDHSS